MGVNHYREIALALVVPPPTPVHVAWTTKRFIFWVRIRVCILSDERGSTSNWGGCVCARVPARERGGNGLEYHAFTGIA